MAWDTSPTISAGLTLTSAWQTLQAAGGGDLVITMTPREVAQVFVECTYQASPTDKAEYQVLASPDGGTTWTTVPGVSGQLDNSPSPQIVDFGVLFVKTFKIQMRQTGSTDTSNVGKAYVLTDNVSA